jgi:hypothetical protein
VSGSTLDDGEGMTDAHETVTAAITATAAERPVLATVEDRRDRTSRS